MIDASTFCTAYHAFWNTNTPTCEHFVRRLNLGGLDRFARPMADLKTAKRRALIAEYAFSKFVALKRAEMVRGQAKSSREIEQEAWREAELRLAPYVGKGLLLDRNLNADELSDAEMIATRLLGFFSNSDRRLFLRPVFAGCGFIDASEGDVIFEDTIYEIKTVERQFRSNDIRQTITYAALNYVSAQYKVAKIGLLNPRSGQYCDIELEHVCAEISGRSTQDLLSIIIDAISSGDISR